MKIYSKSPQLIFTGVFLLVLFLFSSNSFSQLRKMTTKELVDESTAIVHGKCQQTETFWNEKKDKIFTRITVQTQENLKGNTGSETEILIPGGRIGNIIYEVSEMPVFKQGEELVVFLWQAPSGHNLVTGALQGKFTVKEDKKTGKKILLGFSLEKQERTLGKRTTETQRRTNKIYLDDFIGEIKKLIQE